MYSVAHAAGQVQVGGLSCFAQAGERKLRASLYLFLTMPWSNFVQFLCAGNRSLHSSLLSNYTSPFLAFLFFFSLFFLSVLHSTFLVNFLYLSSFTLCFHFPCFFLLVFPSRFTSHVHLISCRHFSFFRPLALLIFILTSSVWHVANKHKNVT